MASRYDSDVDKSFKRTLNRCLLIRAEKSQSTDRRATFSRPGVISLIVIGVAAAQTEPAQTILSLLLTGR